MKLTLQQDRNEHIDTIIVTDAKTKKIICLVPEDEWKEEEEMPDRNIQQHQTSLQTARQCEKPGPQQQQVAQLSQRDRATP